MRCVRFILVVWSVFIFLVTGIPQTVSAEEIKLHMEVGKSGQKTASYSVGQPHRWYIRSRLPESWSEVADFTVLQTLAPALTLEPESVSVKLVMENGEQILLRMEDHYLSISGSVYVEDGTADRLQISLTGEGMEFLEAYRLPKSQLEISYSAKINTHASMGTQILGTAQLNLTDNTGKRYAYVSNKASVSTGGFHIHLTDPTGELPKEGRFLLAREATSEELEDETVMKEVLDIGSETLAVIYERFYTSRNLSGSKTDSAVTDERGNALCYGLAYGTYYLVQTEQGMENVLPSAPICVRVDEASHLTMEDGWLDSGGMLTDRTVYVKHSMPILPRTGGSGMKPFTVSGLIVILCACLLLWYNRKGNYTV